MCKPDCCAEEAEQRVLFLESLLDTFFTGDVPVGATPEHLTMAYWGRKRLEEKSKKAALLQKDYE